MKDERPWVTRTYTWKLPAEVDRLLREVLEMGKHMNGGSLVGAIEALTGEVYIEWRAQHEATTSHIDKARLAALDRDGWVCRWCGHTSGLQVHHVIHRSQGGTDDLLNLISLCARCHEQYHRQGERHA